MSKDRNDRLASDYREMLKIQNRPYLSWIVTKGDLPYAEEYLLTVRLRVYVLSATPDRYRVGVTNSCTVRVTLWDSYPHVAPYIRMLSIPPVFAPDWFSKGTYCSSKPWHKDDSLKEYVMRMLRTLIFTPDVINTTAPVNYKALDWYLKNREKTDWFPSDTVELTENSDDEAAALEQYPDFSAEIVDSWDIR